MKRFLLFRLIICISFGTASYASTCTSWKVATITGYNNQSWDDLHKGHFPDYYNINARFLNNINVIAVHEDDWKKYKYHNIEIKYSNKRAKFQVWDYCSAKDNPRCDKNKRLYSKPGFLVDIETKTAKRVFNINDAENKLRDKIEYRICDPFNPEPIAKRFNAKSY